MTNRLSSRNEMKTQDKTQAAADSVINSSRQISYAAAVRAAPFCAVVSGAYAGIYFRDFFAPLAQIIFELFDQTLEAGKELFRLDHDFDS